MDGQDLKNLNFENPRKKDVKFVSYCFIMDEDKLLTAIEKQLKLKL